MSYPTIIHHGATSGVTGSCHELQYATGASVLIDCGLFQEEDERPLEIDFPVDHIKALIVTHVHIDHVGRIPYLLAAGFNGPIYCSDASAVLLPLVLEDAVRVGFTRDRTLLDRFLKHISHLIVPLLYGKWMPVGEPTQGVSVKLKPAGHILGSSYVECACGKERIVFSGDLGAPYAPLLPAPKAPYRADTLILESTYGDRLHQKRKERRQSLKDVIVKAMQNSGVILVPAFSIGRTQELLYELEALIHQYREQKVTQDLPWDDLEVIVDSPLASRFTDVCRQLKKCWDNEAQKKVINGRHPLSFEQLTTINSHQDHLNTVASLNKHARPCIVIAASGMCSGGRIVNYLKALLGDERTDVLFVGYQAEGTPGREIQKYGPGRGYVRLEGEKYRINAGIHTISGYSAHADQKNLVNFVKRMRHKPKRIILVHGDMAAKKALQGELQRFLPGSQIEIP